MVLNFVRHSFLENFKASSVQFFASKTASPPATIMTQRRSKFFALRVRCGQPGRANQSADGAAARRSTQQPVQSQIADVAYAAT